MGKSDAHSQEQLLADALGEPVVWRPPPEEFSEALDHLTRFPRELGAAAVDADIALQLLLGMLDGGLSLDTVLDTLAMHGDLEDVLDAQEGAAEVRFLAVCDEEGWHAEPAA